jgi:glutathione synthase/RimK-type ligase-like ATP-grasp enzyme
LEIAIISSNPIERSINFFKSVFNQHNINLYSDLNPKLSCELIIIRNHGMDYDDTDLIACEKIEAKFLNLPRGLLLTRDKLEQMSYLSSLGHKVLKTSQNYQDFDYPLVMKTQRGMQGKGVYLKYDEKSILDLYRNDSRYIFQEYIENAIEYRFIYFLGEMVLLKKTSSDFVKNFKSFDDYETSPIPKEWLKTLCHFKQNLGLNFYSLDFFDLNNIPYIFDINGVPGTRLVEHFIKPSKLLKCQENLSSL